MDGQWTIDRRVATLAAQQHGVVSFDQLRGMGISHGAIEKSERAGRLHRLHRGVYAVGHLALSVSGRRMAVVLACGEGAALSHVSAAELWGLRGGSSSRWHAVAPGMSGGRGGPPSVVLHRTLNLHDDDVTTIDGIPVTSVARTLVDLAGAVNAASLARAVHEAEVQRLLDVDAIAAVMARLPRRRGVARLRRLLSASDSNVSSEAFVNAFLRLCSRHGLPTPRVSRHLDALERPVEADIVFPDQRVIVELDSEQYHHTRRNFHSDRRRDSALAAEGWLTVRLTWHRVTRESAEVATELRRILASRAPH